MDGPSFNIGVLIIKRRLILGTLITFGVIAASSVISFPSVALELDADVNVQTVEVYGKVATIRGNSKQVLSGASEKDVRIFFEDTPILAEVARCESYFTHNDPHTGNVIRGRVNSSDVGVMQINEYYHSDTAENMGLELTNFEDNMAYAKYLYDREGTQPWSASKACWQNNLLAMR